MKTQRTMNAPVPYEIRVAGHLSTNWAAQFEGLFMRHEPEGETVLSGMLDQAALHGVLMRIRSLGLNLISINRIESGDITIIEEHLVDQIQSNKGDKK